MASQSSRSFRASRSSASGHRRPILLCHHGEPAVFKVFGTKENPGRRFWGCVRCKVHEECGFFCWADQEQAMEDPEKVKLRKKVVTLKSKLKVVEGKLKIVVFIGLVGWLGVIWLWLQN
ncbi:hypothetical protein PIB30_088263 [Stylosanthes scabra]|uniref:GRF-type domain-containing protein n=1 Tax=Stylosanthes scabra TaxID=79078 RepID=A0ABU6YU03_9FABA|nr:hypothetical protein [Stylosanthes scabra]